MLITHRGAQRYRQVSCAHVDPLRLPGDLLDTHQPLEVLENGRPRNPERGDPRRGAGGAGGHGRDRPRRAGASPRPDPLVPRPQSHPDSGNPTRAPPDTEGIKSHKPFNSLIALPALKKKKSKAKTNLCVVPPLGNLKQKPLPSNSSVLLLS